MVTLGGVQLAFACALALQFAWHFASTWQPPSSLPPLQEIGVALGSLQPAEHVTDAWPWGGERFELYGDGTQSRSFTYVSDVVDAVIRSLAAAPGIYNIGGGEEATMREAIALLEEVSGRFLDVVYGPPQVGDMADGVELVGGRLRRDQQRQVHQLDDPGAHQHQDENAQEQRRSRRLPEQRLHARATRGTNR